MSYLSRSFLVGFILVLIQSTVYSQIVVNNLSDESVYTDQRSFDVPSEAGFDYTVLLSGEPVPTDTTITVDEPDYYELYVERTPTGGGTTESELIQFIIRNSARGGSEIGIPSWVPHAVVDSAAGEEAGGTLHLVAPASYPAGMEIPVIAFVEDDAGEAVRVNGHVESSTHPPIRILRGWGSVLLPAATAAGTLTYDGQLLSLQTNKTIQIEEGTVWTEISTNITGNLDLGDDARIYITADITNAASTVLRVGAGSIIRLASNVDVQLDGILQVTGSTERPVVFTSDDPQSPWGSILLRAPTSRVLLNGAIFKGSGAIANWMGDIGPGSSHRDEQPLFYLQNSGAALLTNCFMIANFGQAGHGENGFLLLEHCLAQNFTTFGQYNGGSVDIRRSALIEFPGERAPFADDDNDGIYLTGGNHFLRNSLIGWTLDDGVDAGSSSSPGNVTVTGCWFESTYHEAMAWSDSRVVRISDTVVLNCGQAVECGFSGGEVNRPDVFARGLLAIGNLTGARYGDNYDWDYSGFLRVTNSILINNYRDVWGFNWDDWTYRVNDMDIRGNLLGAANERHPDNTVFNPSADAGLLLPYRATAPGAVGIGFTGRGRQYDLLELPETLSVGLSMFHTETVSVSYEVMADGAVSSSGVVTFEPGEIVGDIPLSITDPQSLTLLEVRIHSPVNGAITSDDQVVAVPLPATDVDTLLAQGSDWRYLDDGSDQGVAWRAVDFDDSGWSVGPAELGYGDGDESTVIDFGGDEDNKHITYYFRRPLVISDPDHYASLVFRLTRDDGGVVYVNDQELFRSNMGSGIIDFMTVADSSSDTTVTRTFDPSVLSAGTNMVAVEVHQRSDGSSDVSFDLEVLASRQPSLRLRRLGGELLLFWADDAYAVEEADDVAGPWSALPGALSPIRLQPKALQKFYRLISP